ncbi:hypothetical protein E3N88_00194 [Mikania micrantha]|uniref:Uncharacterized protein n=1 Tax=Mikania micrantha TaxID=192012 RepID=A0A5N6PZH1_9ASTR|nr:hypothetical protein E3N88_00194 [Mikania micrantha]
MHETNQTVGRKLAACSGLQIVVTSKTTNQLGRSLCAVTVGDSDGCPEKEKRRRETTVVADRREKEIERWELERERKMGKEGKLSAFYDEAKIKKTQGG